MKCQHCGGDVDTKEVEDGGSPDGCEVLAGLWVCSRPCYVAYLAWLDEAQGVSVAG